MNKDEFLKQVSLLLDSLELNATNTSDIPLMNQALIASYPTCRDWIHSSIHRQNLLFKDVAVSMGVSPSELTRKLNSRHSRSFSIDDLEAYIQGTGDNTPIHYLVSKYITNREGER